MKQAIQVLTFTAVLAFVTWLVWLFGMIFEFEYPYTFILMSVQSAKSVSGIAVSGIVRGDGARWPSRLHWHTCSYCADSCGNVKGLIKCRNELDIYMDLIKPVYNSVVYYNAIQCSMLK